MKFSMRAWVAAATALMALLSGPASAETLDEFTAKGGVINIEGLPPIDIKFTTDGKFSLLGGLMGGAYRVDGDKLCLKGDMDPAETCTPYPKGKKSGDTFDVPMPQGKASVKIN